MRFGLRIGVAAFAGMAICAPRAACAQAPTPTPAPPAAVHQLERDFFKNLLRDQKAIWTSPAHLRSDDIWWVASLAGATSAFFATDRKTGDAVARHPQLKDPSVAVSYAGAGYSVAGAAASFYVVGRLTHSDRAIETGLLGTEAFVDSSIVVLAVKSATQRVRPDGGEDRGKFFVGGSSFPSGHSSGIWSLATVVASEYHDRPIVPITAYTVASLVSVARFTAQRHYMSDVLIGSAVGFGVGRYVYRTHHIDATRAGTAASPSLERGGTGRWPLISPEVNRHVRAYSIRLTWIY